MREHAILDPPRQLSEALDRCDCFLYFFPVLSFENLLMYSLLSITSSLIFVSVVELLSQHVSSPQSLALQLNILALLISSRH